MLKSRKRNKIGLFVPKNNTQQGELIIEGRIRIEGQFTGSLSTDSTLEIAPGGFFSGKANAHSVELYGECEGELIVSNRFHLRKGGRFSGLLDTCKMSIEDQGVFFGEIRISGQ